MRTWTIGAAACLIGIAGSAWASGPADVPSPRGLWPMPRHDAGNTGRAAMEGSCQAAPVEVWRYGLPRREYGYVHPVSIGGKPAFVRQSGATLQVVFPNGKVLWSSHTLGVGQIVSLVRF